MRSPWNDGAVYPSQRLWLNPRDLVRTMDSSLVEDYKEEDEELEGFYDSDDILSSLPKEYKSGKEGEMKNFQTLHIKPRLPKRTYICVFWQKAKHE